MTAIEQYGEYEERDMKYDANGNLLAMKRIMSWEDSTHLSFGYSGNRMETVSADDSLWRYSYDSDGDMVSDGHRGLELSYNFLNLPSRIRIKDSGSLVYSYLSDGTMLSVTDSLSGRGLKFRGSFIYTVSPEGEESVESVSYGEGRLYACTRTPSADDAGQGSIDAGPDFIDTWFVRDYLGSVRMVIDISRHEAQCLPEVILSRSDYLPFGLPFSPARYSVASAMQRSDASDALQETSSGASGIPQSALTRWQYNGKPEQVTGIAETGLLDYGARFYDPYVARWTSVDPMADKYPGCSPYVFCADNPVNFVDPDGMDKWSINWQGFIVWEEEYEEDELYYKDEYGNLTDKHIVVGNGDILQALSATNGSFSSYTSDTGINDIFKVFKFAADNTDAEWVIHKNGDTYTIGTKHDPDNSGGWEDYGLEKPEASVHPRPGIP
ncbi:MAG: RHS repeat-associated core domain-containing protein [Bacteroidales bacterium]|nr:RHS repeat-associated core domain-containing protein [Bacteroidales bacterium]